MVPVRRILAALLALHALTAVPAAQAQTSEPQPVRFDTADGTPLIGWLFLPQGAAPKGTVVALHGCSGLYATTGARRGGLAARHQAWGELLAKDGYAVLLPDSLTSRGFGSACSAKPGQRVPSARERAGDAQAALRWAAAQPWAGQGKAAVLGWSQGGAAVLSLAAEEAAPPQQRLAAVIALYPFCPAPPREAPTSGTKLVLLLAGKDERAPAAACQRYGQAVGAEVQTLADAGHAFDDPAGDERFRLDVPGASHPVRGALAERNATAREQAQTRVRELLQEALR